MSWFPGPAATIQLCFEDSTSVCLKSVCFSVVSGHIVASSVSKREAVPASVPMTKAITMCRWPR